VINYDVLLSSVLVVSDQDVQLLLLSLAAATLIQALQMRGVLRGLLQVAAGVLLTATFFWSAVVLTLPVLAKATQQLTANAWAWLVLLLVVLTMNALLPALKRAS
jgi:hypothetical protein